MSTSAPVPTAPAAAGAAAANTAAAAAAGRNNTFTSASLYVGDLAPDVTEAVLFDIFNAVGPVASVRVCRDAQTRRSLGYAYVNFHRVDDAERALDTLNFKPIKNRPCRIMWSHRDPTLRKSGQGNIFVKNLAKSIDNKQLYDTFSMFGNILSCKVASSGKGDSLGYGFVHYEADEAAALAIEKVNKKVIAGEKVIVMPFKSKKERGGVNKDKYTNVYVKNLPGDYTKEQLQELFSKYGRVTSCMVAAPKEDAKESKRAGFGFVNMETHEEAAAAVAGLDGFELEGKTLSVCRAQKKEEREKELREKFENLKIERQKKWAGINLYIKNLADETTEEKLREMFAPFGTIQSCHIARDEKDKKSRGFGFVCFQTPEEATKAVTDMNGKMVDSKPLYVALAQRKDVRRNQLEQRFASRVPKGGPMGPQPPMFPPNMPMFYPQQPRAGGPFMYPQMAWRGAPMPGPQMMGQMRGQPTMGAYQLMPVHGGRGGAPAGAAPGRGGRGGRGGQQGSRGQQQGGPQQQQQQQVQQQQQGAPSGANYKYTENARNRGQGQQAAQGDVPADTDKASNPKTSFVQELAQAGEKQKKQMIGEQLFPLIKSRQPVLAGKITGMLLEMDNSELIHLLESGAALDEKVAEALDVLNTTEGAEPQAQQAWN
jgi:polyadenylate-binding protein